jgi:hypothetical protein
VLTFIDANIPPEVTEPNREGRMSLGRTILHEDRTEDYSAVAFALRTLVDFVTANYSGRMIAIMDAFDVLCEIGLMRRQIEEIEPGHPMYGKKTEPGCMLPGDPSRFNKPMQDPAVSRARGGLDVTGNLEAICRALAEVHKAERIMIDNRGDVYVQRRGEKSFIRFTANAELQRVMRGEDDLQFADDGFTRYTL